MFNKFPCNNQHKKRHADIIFSQNRNYTTKLRKS